MRRNSRYISLDICDYNGNTLCNLFDSAQDLSGQAHDVYCKSQRNGFKELRFKLPAVCIDEELGNVRNYRLDKLISDYRIRTKKRKNNGEFETDWFLISEEKVIHESKTTFDVRASHISQLLKTKNLDKEFSDEDGNNVGTIAQIAEEILEGTGWHLGYNQIAVFKEEDKYLNGEDKEKVRTFTAPAKTGAFKMMSDLCDLFDAKVIYHGEGLYQATNEDGALLVDEHNKPILLTGRTVEIVPMNPFSKDIEPDTIPNEVLKQKKVLELHYSKNVKNVTRTMNTDNLITKLSAYGSYGDLNGMCSLQTAEHAVLTFENLDENTSYYFTYNKKWFYFTTTNAIQNGKWSALDFVSRSYLYYYTDDKLNIVKVYKDKIENATKLVENTDYTISIERNFFPFVMDFSYYQKVGLLTDDMIEALADYQINMPEYYEASERASIELAAAKSDLMKTASDGEGYIKLCIDNIFSPDDYIVLHLDKREYSDGIIYRSDYDEARRKWFSLRPAKGIKNNGEAISAIGNIVYLIRDGNPTKWLKSYVRFIGNEDGDYFYDDLKNRYVIQNKTRFDESYITSEPKTPGQSNVIYVDNYNFKLYVWDETYDDTKTWHYKPVYAASYEFGSSKFDAPTRITLWNTINDLQFAQFPQLPTDTVYLFSADSIAGMFGPREDSVESNIESTKKSVQVVSENHPFNIIYKSSKDETIFTSMIPEKDLAKQNYGWCYVSNQYHYKEDPDTEDDYYKFGQLYFLWNGLDDDWKKVYISFDHTVPPIANEYAYYYDVKYKHLYMLENDEWSRVKDTVDDDNVVNAFGVVVSGCINHEIYTKGVAESYTYHGDTLSVGNYAFKNEFNSYWLFTTDIETDTLKYVTSGENKAVWQNDSSDSIVKPSEYTFDVLTFPSNNEMTDVALAHGSFNEDNWSFSQDGDQIITGNIYVFEDVKYKAELPEGSIIVFCNKRNKVIGEKDEDGVEFPAWIKVDNHFTGEFKTPISTTHIRVVFQPEQTKEAYLEFMKNHNEQYIAALELNDDVTMQLLEHEWELYYEDSVKSTSSYEENILSNTYYIQVKDYQNKLFAKNVEYTILPTTAYGDRFGLPYLMDQFIKLSDVAFLEKLPALLAAQNTIKKKNVALMETLGDMYREGYWQETNYVGGDDAKLYADSLDNLYEVSHPETTYEFGYLDLYGTDKYYGLSVDESFEEVDWPLIDITYAAHLVDMDIDTNCWAYIDEVNECYDQPRKTTIAINTKLSNMGQQTFTDVLASIAQVANEVKAKQTVYQRAANITESGELVASKVTGILQTNRVYISGGTSNWYTDAKGNIIFEDSSGESAMMLSGRGWAVSTTRDASGDWEWKYIGTGKGLSAEAIYTGYLAAERIEAGSITVDKLSSTIGHDLEIGTNKALALFATKDGSRPSGAVLTKHDSIIEISTGDEAKGENGYVNVRSGGNVSVEAGGNMNILGGNINIRAQNTTGWSQWIAGTHYLVDDKVVHNSFGYKCKTENSDTEFDEAKWVRASDGNINVYAGGNINIATEGTLSVSSGNLFVGNRGQGQIVEVRGKITAESGNIAGFEIGSVTENDVVRHYLYAGADHESLNSTNMGVYLGDDGINIGGKFIFSADGENSSMYVDAGGGIFIGEQGSLSTTGISIIPGEINLFADSLINIASTGSIVVASSEEQGSSAMILNGSGIALAADNSISLASGDKSVFTLDNSGIMLGSIGAIHMATGSTFTVDSQKFAIDDAGNVSLTGQITAESGLIAGWRLASDYLGAKYIERIRDDEATIAQGEIIYKETEIIDKEHAKAGISSDDSYAFWAGNNNAVDDVWSRNNAKFYVTPSGKVKCADLEMTGGSINGNQIAITAGSISLAAGGNLSLSGTGSIILSSGTGSNLSQITIKPSQIDMNSTGVFRLSGNNTGGGSYIKLYNGSTRVFEANSAGSIYAQVFQGNNITITNATVTGTLTVNKHNINVPRIYVDSRNETDVKNDSKYAKPFFWVKPGSGTTTETTNYETWAYISNSGDTTSSSSPVTRTVGTSSAWSGKAGDVSNNATIEVHLDVTRVVGSSNVNTGVTVTVNFANNQSLYMGSIAVPAAYVGQHGTTSSASATLSQTYSGSNTKFSSVTITCWGGDGDSYYNRNATSGGWVKINGSTTTTSGSDYDTIKYIQ